MFRKALGAAIATALGAGLMVSGTVVPAQAKPVKACVKKKTGEVRILTGSKKCKKGWKKVTWNKKGATGPEGQAGAKGDQGPNLVVKDGTGATVGRFLGTFAMGPGILIVEVNGGIFTYMGDGTLSPSGSPLFKSNTCSGIAYLKSPAPLATDIYTGLAGGPTRLVYRVSNPALGASTAYAFTTITENVAALQMWERDANAAGACVADSGGAFTGTLIALQVVPAPPDVPGPLTVQ